MGDKDDVRGIDSTKVFEADTGIPAPRVVLLEYKGEDPGIALEVLP